MNTRRTSATALTPARSVRAGKADELAVVPARQPAEFTVPDVTLLTAINAAATGLSQQMMELTYGQPASLTAAKADALLAEAARQIAAIEAREADNPGVRASLDGSRTALLTAVRELREHLMRHGWVVDGIRPARLA